VDSLSGYPENDGLTEATPIDTYKNIDIKPGDRVLFRRGTSYRDGIHFAGLDGEPVTFGAYGNGEAPKFFGSINRSEPYLWGRTEKDNVWQLLIPLKSSVGNVIFDFGDHCGIKARGVELLDAQGKWYSEGDGGSYSFFLYSTENPGEYYIDIEIALRGVGCVISAEKNTVFENLTVFGSGLHGFSAKQASNVKIDDCRFEFIGGCLPEANSDIRCGNAVDFDSGCESCSVENSYFYNIFDSCVSVKTVEADRMPRKLSFVGNSFNKYGMAALELRGKIGDDVLFELNECVNAGRGFSLGGEIPPRLSVASPLEIGHHVFIWRTVESEKGSVVIRRNVFRGKTVGENVCIDTDNGEVLSSIVIENNEIQ